MKNFKLLTKNDLKLLRGILVCIILGFVFFYLFIYMTISRRNEIIANWYCENNLKRINQAILIYANKHDGEMPITSTWADLILEENQLVFKEDFVTPASWTSWGICYNKSFEEKNISDLKAEAVILFMAKGDWNASGSKELFCKDSVSRKHSCIITLNGDIYRHDPDRDCFTRIRDNVIVESDSLSWQ